MYGALIIGAYQRSIVNTIFFEHRSQNVTQIFKKRAGEAKKIPRVVRLSRDAATNCENATVA